MAESPKACGLLSWRTQQKQEGPWLKVEAEHLLLKVVY